MIEKGVNKGLAEWGEDCDLEISSVNVFDLSYQGLVLWKYTMIKKFKIIYFKNKKKLLEMQVRGRRDIEIIFILAVKTTRNHHNAPYPHF